jgi:hypothetical protein
MCLFDNVPNFESVEFLAECDIMEAKPNKSDNSVEELCYTFGSSQR